jgi:wobble nucleotide-excising tRNase
MIESITIANIATYGTNSEKLEDLSKFNYIFGSNGTGKTTISRIIADEGKFSSCKVIWKNGTKFQTMVYNHDFIERNFNQLSELKGVFTLGEQNVDTLNRIKLAKVERDDLSKNIEALTQGLGGIDGKGGKRGELSALEEELKNKCWSKKQKHDLKLQGAFKGYRDSAEKFKAKILEEQNSNSALLLPQLVLEEKAETVFGPKPAPENSIPMIEMTKILEYESASILKKSVIGKEDVDIASMIKKLGSSDWVREGRAFYDVNEYVCPFCQQGTTEGFAKSLNEYFDEAFETDSKAINDLSNNYVTDSSRLQQQLASIISSSSRFLNLEKLKAESDLLDSRLAINIQRIEMKKKEPSLIVELESIDNVVKTITKLVSDANDLIAAHNQTVANLSKERIDLTAQIWKFVLEELKVDLTTYRQKRINLENAIKSMGSQIEQKKQALLEKEAEIRELEKRTTSIQPTIDGINALLLEFGFQSFSLSKADNGKTYKLVRPDNSDAKATLSEGEKTFVTFLYFYHLLKGSDSESGMTTDRIVVFDDPVSSLDSDILFIVGSLIKRLFDEVREGKGHIKQVFVLTHNVYFHKEVTFNPKRSKDNKMSEETFWVVRKSGLESKLVNHESNPVKTSYELLWSEVRNPDSSSLTIQNTLRRILENYFKFYGGIDPKEIVSKFSGKDQIICNTLLSWINDGSHYAHDDLFISMDTGIVEIYLKVFKEIFEKSGHFAHYNMMMGNDFEKSIQVES